jgi:hypothetical protein
MEACETNGYFAAFKIESSQTKVGLQEMHGFRGRASLQNKFRLLPDDLCQPQWHALE